MAKRQAEILTMADLREGGDLLTVDDLRAGGDLAAKDRLRGLRCWMPSVRRMQERDICFEDMDCAKALGMDL